MNFAGAGIPHLKVGLGGINTSEVTTDGEYSFLVTPLNTKDLEVWGEAGSAELIQVLDISVKEILPPPVIPDTILIKLQTATGSDEIIIELTEDTKFGELVNAIKILWKIWIP